MATDMGEGALRYDRMVQEALRGVVGRALAHVAEHGLPGNHHFYITFRTAHPGVRMSEALRSRFPSEMTIVLQHQFWDLEVGRESFAVTLSFADVAERLSIPYQAVATFADPEVSFGLRFDAGQEDAGAGEADGAAPLPDPAEPATAESSTRDTPDRNFVVFGNKEEESTDEEPADKVVSFDTFRKR